MNMIFPRLNLARNLLRDDGLIFMSIDDVELANLRKIADEVFGEDCFVANFIWEKRTNRENRKVVSSRHDYILCYCKNSIQKSSVIQQLPMSEKALANYKNPDNDPRGPWKSDPATAQAGHGTKSQFYVFTAPNGKEHHLESGRCWLYTKDVFEEEVRQGKIWFGKDGNGVPRVKTYLEAKERGLTPETIWFAADVATNEIAKTQLKELFDGDSVFETPKPAALIKHAIQICSGTDGIVLDFFAGSGVTAEAVLRQNAEDGGDRKFILVQLPERIEHKLYKRISDITIERVKRVVSQTSATSTPANGRGDAGFRVFELDSSNFEGWNADVTHDPKTLQRQLELYVSHLREDRTSEDVLFELLLKSGFDLATPISKDTLAGKTVYSVASGSFLICLDEDINLDLIREIARRKPERIVCLDRGFAGNDQLKANAMQIFKANGVESFKTV
jgi:adenine-specific DNA-methyltransferase